MITAHIGGVPVEETLAMVAPAAGIWASLTIYEIRRRLHRRPGAARRHPRRG